MSNVKEKMTEVTQSQPEDASYEEIMRKITSAHMVERGLEDYRGGRVIPDEDMEHRIRLKPPASASKIIKSGAHNFFKKT